MLRREIDLLVHNLIFAGPATTKPDGSSTSPLTDRTANGSFLELYVNPTALTGRYNGIRVECLAAPASAAPAGVYAIRGYAGVATGKTVAGSTASYLAGVQGKLHVGGTIGNGSSGAIYACGGLSQTDGEGSMGSETQWYGHWIDNQRAANMPATSHMLNVTNNGGQVTNCLKIYGNNKITKFMNIETGGGGMVGAGGTFTCTASLACVINGASVVIPLGTLA